jgi:hypothetical protein
VLSSLEGVRWADVLVQLAQVAEQTKR